jgi:hypothetical protein
VKLRKELMAQGHCLISHNPHETHSLTAFFVGYIEACEDLLGLRFIEDQIEKEPEEEEEQDVKTSRRKSPRKTGKGRKKNG